MSVIRMFKWLKFSQKEDLSILDRAGRPIGVVDSFSGAPLPLVRVVGWTSEQSLPIAMRTRSDTDMRPQHFCRLARPDVMPAMSRNNDHSGFRADFYLEPGNRPIALKIGHGREMSVPHAESFGTVRPHYESLFHETRVLRREDIYGYGPPTDSTEQHKKLLAGISGRVLDFGCGNGDSLLALRAMGCDARGVELDTPRIHGALKSAAKAFTTLYAGGIPLPFEDASFDWIVSSEVIEHIDDIERYVPEFARVLRPGGRMFLTTPDISSIPSSYPTGTVPWHLLESTHVRFFTPTSLKKMLADFFEPQVSYSVGDNVVNGWLIPGSIAGTFRKR